MAASRLSELRISSRNLRKHEPTRELNLSRRTFPLIVFLHSLVIGGTLLFGRNRLRLRWLLILIAMQPLRFWVLATLADRWTARGRVPLQMEVETTGPYAFIRHPNYAIIVVELAALPAAFGRLDLSLGGTIINAALLTIRIRDEEALLFQLPGYKDHFSGKARLLPGIF